MTLTDIKKGQEVLFRSGKAELQIKKMSTFLSLKRIENNHLCHCDL